VGASGLRDRHRAARSLFHPALNARYQPCPAGLVCFSGGGGAELRSPSNAAALCAVVPA